MKRAKRWIGISVCMAFIFLMLCAGVLAVPGGPTISYITNSTRDTTTPTSRALDDGGYITTMNLTMEQQTEYWKAYVGNVTGSITLDDASSQTIYSWAFTTITGEIYATRASSITWGDIECANSTIILAEQSYLNMTADQIFSLENTFNYSTHSSFIVSGKNITESSCNATATYVNDTAQTIDLNADYQEVLLQSGSDMVYASLISNNEWGYNGSVFDFQILVGEAETAPSPLTYYFYAELG